MELERLKEKLEQPKVKPVKNPKVYDVRSYKEDGVSRSMVWDRSQSVQNKIKDEP